MPTYVTATSPAELLRVRLQMHTKQPAEVEAGLILKPDKLSRAYEANLGRNGRLSDFALQALMVFRTRLLHVACGPHLGQTSTRGIRSNRP